MSTQAFMPMGKTVMVAANTTAPIGELVDANLRCSAFRVANPEGNETIFYAFAAGANGAGDARLNAKLPGATATNGNQSIPLPAGAVEVIRAPAGAYFSGITRTAAGGNLYVTPGEGI